MKKAGIILSHTLTEEQTDYLKKVMGASEIAYFPNELKSKWQNIPPELDNLDEYLQIFFDWINKSFVKGDILVVQGDYGATYKLVNFAKSNGIIAVYATTKREALERKNEDGTITLERVFKFVRFREY